jgi:hypothetical protein
MPTDSDIQIRLIENFCFPSSRKQDHSKYKKVLLYHVNNVRITVKGLKNWGCKKAQCGSDGCCKEDTERSQSLINMLLCITNSFKETSYFIIITGFTINCENKFSILFCSIAVNFILLCTSCQEFIHDRCGAVLPATTLMFKIAFTE